LQIIYFILFGKEKTWLDLIGLELCGKLETSEHAKLMTRVLKKNLHISYSLLSLFSFQHSFFLYLPFLSLQN